ncbi:MAG: hypothetical protein ACM3O8_07405 [Methylococcaceae bacterium]|nr:hypothetical protein [Prolixibacteraceae bacterium]
MKIYPFKYLGKFSGITLAPIGIFIKPAKLKDLCLLNHEHIHWQQQKEMLIVPFYLWYVIEWLFKGYRDISFEKEAYLNEHNPEYLTSRKRFAWTRYL